MTKYKINIDSNNTGHMTVNGEWFYTFDNPRNTEAELRCIKNNMAEMVKMTPVDRVLFTIKNR